MLMSAAVLFLSVIPLTFQGNHGWSEGNAGLPYLALILGCFAGFATGLWQDHLYRKDTVQRGGTARPEARLFGAMYFGPLFGIGIVRDGRPRRSAKPQLTPLHNPDDLFLDAIRLRALDCTMYRALPDHRRHLPW
jgi:hypothetical protein